MENFYTTIEISPEIVDLIVKCTSVLHNLLIDMEGQHSTNDSSAAMNDAFVAIDLSANRLCSWIRR